MDQLSHMFSQGYGPVSQRPAQQTVYRPSMPQHHHRGGDDESDGSSHRIAHTLTACCRCRQRKTRCDPTLPRCLPCERSGSICEYFDTIKGKKISRFFVVKLQEKVRQLETELSQYTDDDEFPKNSEDIVRPGGLVRLNDSDETPRYLGPSSGIAMTRLLMEEAKRYTDSKRISELIPEVRARRLDRMNRMQSIVSISGSISGPAARRRSYPMLSSHPAPNLPTRPMTERLVDIFNTRAQVFFPTLHEKVFAKDVEEVFAGTTDPHKNFVVRMVLAISLQKLDSQYAGLADSYYLAAMQLFERVVRTKDLRTLQCLVLLGQYSLLTPVRTNIYHVVGLGTRICQQLGYGDEKTLTRDASMVDPLTLDMRRRMTWIVAVMEFGLAHSMGRPSGFAKGDDLIDVGFFSIMPDEAITEEGIRPGPPSDTKQVAIHMCKMRLCQAEIRRTLYEKKKPEPRDDSHPWFASMAAKVKEWVDNAPEQPVWCKPWFTGRYHTMVVFMNRPSPQVPKPSSASAMRCFESSSFIVDLSSQQVKKGAIDITWVFLLTIYMSLNTMLWAASSYLEVRQKHSRHDLEALVNTALEVLDQCAERWPGAAAASQLYAVFAKACMQSYDGKFDGKDSMSPNGDSIFATSPSLIDSNSPSMSENSLTSAYQAPPAQSQAPVFSVPQFGYVFGPPEPVGANFGGFDNPFQQHHPQFRTNSIFMNPGSNEPAGRRQSHFAPDALSRGEKSPGQVTPTAPISPHAPQHPHHQPSTPMGPNTLPTPPESMVTPGPSTLSPSSTTFTGHTSPTPTPTLTHASPLLPSGLPVHQQHIKFEPPPPHGLAQQNLKFEPPQTPQSQATPQPQRTPTFTIPPLRQGGPAAARNTQQQPLPTTTTVTDWFNPPPPFISPYAFSGAGHNSASAAATNNNNSYFPDPSSTFSGLGLGGGGGVGALGAFGGGDGAGGAGGGMPYGFAERQGSLSQEQQMELMDVLETEGMGEIDTFLNLGIGLSGVDGGVSW